MNNRSKPSDKIALFRSLFRGRDDVYPRRFESRKTGKSGYTPSGQDDSGRDFVMGVYPMLQDETCFILAADFDKERWQDDVSAFMATCRRMGLPVALERSRSGNGGHVWLFFDQALPATLARKLGANILTETMERRPDIGSRFMANCGPSSWLPLRQCLLTISEC